VNRNGVLTGKNFFGGERMAELLELEGMRIENDQIQDFRTHFWDPSIELL
jgi:methylated-DNA-protein-cysteine methyltransferase-like protein